MTACPDCGQENPARFALCGICGAPLSSSESSARQVRKTVTVVFCDVVGSTAIADRADPEVVHALMSTYFDRGGEYLFLPSLTFLRHLLGGS